MINLQKILDDHKKWIVSNGAEGERADLQRANLQRANLQRANLQRANLQRANLQRADLQGADLQRANLRRADLQGADLQRADLQGADLQRADLQDADLQGADLQGADLDFSSWPLWCGSLDVKIDARIFDQLAYHLCRVDVNDEERKKMQLMLGKFANKFHRVNECGHVPTE